MTGGVIELRRSAANRVFVLVACVLMILLGWWLVTGPASGGFVTVWGWITIAFFGLGFPLVVLQVLRRGPMVTISDAGIWVWRWQWGTIPWSEIAAVETRAMSQSFGGGQKFLLLHMRHPEAWGADSTSASISRALGLPGVPVPVSGLTMSPEDIEQEVQLRISRSLVEQSSAASRAR